MTSVTALSEFVNDYVIEWISEVEKINKEDFDFLGINMDELVQTLVKKEKNEEIFKKDMLLICYVCQFRGAKLSKVVGKMKTTGRGSFQGIINKYGIVEHRTGLPASQPSLPRILGLFPQLVFQIRRTYQDKIGDPLGNLGLLPYELAFPGGAAMIRETNADMLERWMQWYENFCNVVRMQNVPTREQMMIPHRMSKVPMDSRV